MQLRKNTSPSPAQVVVKMRDSLMEPALRFKHSLQDPLHYKRAASLTAEPAAAGGGGGAPLRATTTIHIPARQNAVTATLGPFGTAKRIVQREGFFALYKGLTAVYTGIIPKMAIRFVSFEQYRELFQSSSYLTSHVNPTAITFTAGLLSGLTEAIMVVTPSEVCKVRMMGQYHSMVDPAAVQKRKYTNVIQTALVITKEEGYVALFELLWLWIRARDREVGRHLARLSLQLTDSSRSIRIVHNILTASAHYTKGSSLPCCDRAAIKLLISLLIVP
jgi:hypothetical protein